MSKFFVDLLALLKWTRRYPRARALSCGLLSALFLILSFPFFDSDGLWFLAVLIPLPMMILARDPAMRPNRAAFFGGLGTLPAWAWTHQWMWEVSQAGTPFLLLYLAFFPGLFVWAGNRVQSRIGQAWITLPLAWVGIEFLRAHALFTGYPWYISPQPLIGSPGQILAGPAAIADNGGMYLVGLLSAVFVWLLWESVVHDGKRFKALARSGVVLLIWIGIGLIGLRVASGSDDGRTVVVGIVQPNIPQDNRMDWTDRQRYADWLMLRELTIASANDPLTPEFIVWPEGFVPGWTFDPISLEHEREYGFTWNLQPRSASDAPDLGPVPNRVPATTIVDQLLAMQQQLDIPMVVGSVAFENLKITRDDEDWVLYTNDAMFNSAFVVDHGTISPVWYNKMHLTPFGEVMPVISRWEWLETQLLSLGATGMEFALHPGDDPVVLDIPTQDTHTPIKIGTPICFEATVPEACRRLVFDGSGRRADLLVNITNDGWFGSWDPSRRSHMLIARWRCLELGTPMIRSANTGVSCVIDRKGALVQDRLTRVDPDDPLSGYLNARVQLGTGTPFVLSGFLGIVFGWGILALTGIGLILSYGQYGSEPTPGADE